MYDLEEVGGAHAPADAHRHDDALAAAFGALLTLVNDWLTVGSWANGLQNGPA